MEDATNKKIKSCFSRTSGWILPRHAAEDGSAMVIALLVMLLLASFVTLAITRTNSETIAGANDAAESRTFDAAQASLEVMTRNFDKIFDAKLNPDPADLTGVETALPPGFANYQFDQNVVKTDTARTVQLNGDLYQGLSALQDKWSLDTEVTEVATGVQVNLKRHFLNNRIPIFQFGIFYDDDMEFHPGPRFDFGGRVHSNGHIFTAANTGLYFSSKVTAHGQVFTNVSKSGRPYTDWGDNVWIRNGAGVYTKLAHNRGSVLTTPLNGAPVTSAPLPTAYANAGWAASAGTFGGNLLSETSQLKLPIKLNSENNGNTALDLVELVKRGKAIGDVWNENSLDIPRPTGTPSIVAVANATKDDLITASERYYNKTGIRVSLADSKAKLPGCADSSANPITAACGVRLDGAAVPGADGQAPLGTGPRGYKPKAMTDGYQATQLNGERFHIPGRESWIKIETVQYNATSQNYDTKDITEDILSLGVTEMAPTGAILDSRYPTGTDSRSVIKLQRYVMPGQAIQQRVTASPNSFITVIGANNYVVAATVPANVASTECNTAAGPTIVNGGDSTPNGFTQDHVDHFRRSGSIGASGSPGTPGSRYGCVVPFPINMFDTREGLFNETPGDFNRDNGYRTGGIHDVPWAGVMSMVDIDVDNLKDFLDGDYDSGTGPRLPATGTKFATDNSRSLLSTDIPSSNGWVFYVSDRRGDFDFDGEYDMEDTLGNNNGTLDPSEDVNGDGALQVDFVNEAARYCGATGGTAPFCIVGTSRVSPDVAAVFDHRYYRRGVRLINGSDLPGEYNTTTPSATRGFTVASENGVYVLGNYNANNVASVGSPTPYTDYLPQGTRDVPASIAADSVTILSNDWTDARSFRYPFDLNNRPADTVTYTRFAMLSGDTITTLNGTPNQGGGDPRMGGGVHNYKRFLENWNVRLHYAGSLINLFNSKNNNGQFKCCNTVYSPPTRNWVFDASFLDINRIPPGTPFFQSIQITGFQRMN